MLLLTNTDKETKEILEIHLTHWKCQESFRFLKHHYHLEDLRVRRYTGLRNTVVLVGAIFYFLNVYLGRKNQNKYLTKKDLRKSKKILSDTYL